MRTLLTAILGTVLALGMIACTSDDEGAATPAPAATTAVAASAEASATTTAAKSPAATEPATATAAPTATAATVAVATAGALAPYLVDAEGRTLYRFANDEPGVSNCTGACLANWPALTVEGGPTAGEGVTGILAVIAGADGTQHVTYNDQPLYYFAGDTAPGDTNGHEAGGVWFVAQPDGSTAAAPEAPGRSTDGY